MGGGGGFSQRIYWKLYPFIIFVQLHHFSLTIVITICIRQYLRLASKLDWSYYIMMKMLIIYGITLFFPFTHLFDLYWPGMKFGANSGII